MIVVRRGRPRQMERRHADIDDMARALMTGRGAVSGRNRGTWRPALEVYETEDGLDIVAELAGMDREEIEVVIEGDVLSIRGNRPDPATCEHRSYHEARIPYGAFSADVYIPFSVEADETRASYENGFLRISLPRAQGRTITPRRAERDASTNHEREDA